MPRSQPVRNWGGMSLIGATRQYFMELAMTRSFVWLSTAAITLAFSSSTSFAASGWDRTWSGAWGGKEEQAATITVSGKKVVSYSFQGLSHPVASSNVTDNRITY